MGNAESGPEFPADSYVEQKPSSFSRDRMNSGDDWDHKVAELNAIKRKQYLSNNRDWGGHPSGESEDDHRDDWGNHANTGDDRNQQIGGYDKIVSHTPSAGFAIEEDLDEDYDEYDNYEMDERGVENRGIRARDVREAASKHSGDDDDDDDDDGIIHVFDDHESEIDGAMSLMETSAAVFHYLSQAQGNDLGGDISVSDRSAAVFHRLDKETREGGNETMLGLLRTASAVSAAIMDENQSVSGASADVFKVLENVRSEEDEKSAAISKLIDKTKKEVDADSVSEFSAAVSKAIEEAKSKDSDAVSNHPAAVFQFLDDASQASRSQRMIRNLPTPVSPKSIQSPRVGRYAVDLTNLASPKSQALTAPIQNLQPIDEQESIEDAGDVATRGDFDEVETQEKNNRSRRNEMKMWDEPNPEGMEDIDLNFVGHFDKAFNEFIGRNPRFLLINPDLVHHLRIAKLQQLLHFQKNKERDLMIKFTKAKGKKEQVELEYQLKLREAARKKAARQINLQSDLNKLSQSTKQLEAQSTWKFFSGCELRAKRLHRLHLQYSKKIIDPNREDLARNIPEGLEGKQLKKALVGRLPEDEPREDQIRKCQVENAFLLSEVSVLKKKLETEEKGTRQFNWIDSVLVKMDEDTKKRLKEKFANKVGISTL